MGAAEVISFEEVRARKQRRFPQGENDQHFWVFQRSSRVLEDHWEIPQPGNRLARLIESGFP